MTSHTKHTHNRRQKGDRHRGHKPPRSTRRKVAHGVGWTMGLPIAAFLLLYLTLVITPIPMPFVGDRARDAVLEALPESYRIELGGAALALKDWVQPVLHFEPVEMTDSATGARITMQALEVGFSPWRALFGQPTVTVELVGPHIQAIQDLLGPRLARFDVEESADGGGPMIRIHAGEAEAPTVGISAGGVDLEAEQTPGGVGLRSDNDWLIYNFMAGEESLVAFAEQVKAGQFSRLSVRRATVDLHDGVYSLYRRMEDVTFDLAPSVDGKKIEGSFAFTIAGRRSEGSFEREVLENGDKLLSADVTNLDFSNVMPFLDDQDAIVAIKGGGSMSMRVVFAAEGDRIRTGEFYSNMTGTELVVQNDRFPVRSETVRIDWNPEEGQFDLQPVKIGVGDSTAIMSGTFRMGLDAKFGPVMGMLVNVADVSLHPGDMAAPAQPFTSMVYSGWSAPLYGAIGIDEMRIEKPGMQMVTTGRMDVVRKGIGFDLSMRASGASTDDLARLWPYFLNTENRDWFVKNITAGRIEQSSMHFKFPVGSIAPGGDIPVLPKDSISIDILATGVQVKPTDTMAELSIDGNTRLQIRDSRLIVNLDGSTLQTASGPMSFSQGAIIIEGADDKTGVVELSGDVRAGIPALIALGGEQAPEMIAGLGDQVDPKKLKGDVTASVIATVRLDPEGEIIRTDYAVNGNVTDFSSGAPLAGYMLDEGKFSFVASQAGYRVTGNTRIDGVKADVALEGQMEEGGETVLKAEIPASGFKELGFDASEFLTGSVRLTGTPHADGTVDILVDLAPTGINIKDIGISKKQGVAGKLSARLKLDGTMAELSDVNLAFDTVRMAGSVAFDTADGLTSATFDTFQLSEGDKARLSVKPVEGGISLALSGAQLDLKPMLKRYFSLGGGATGSPEASLVDQTVFLKVDIERALGFFKTTGYNLALDMALRGSDMPRLSLQGQFGDGKVISATTNQVPGGRVMTIAFNDLGTVMRFVGIYPRLLGGEGSLVLNTRTAEKMDLGEFNVRGFALVDEEAVGKVVGSQQGRVTNSDRVSFRSGRAEFIRRKDRIEIKEAMVTGDEMGGTMRGFIYTEQGKYDLAGTYIPLAGLNSIFQKLPLFGPLLGGRDGEGLIGITFAVRGDLDKPDFLVNPASLLAIGAFRSLFEFRAKEQPRQE